jgi:hypothetical protein
MFDESMKKDEFLLTPIKKIWCVYHPFIKESDLVDFYVRKTGQMIKKCRICIEKKEERRKKRQTDWQYEKDNLTDYYILRTFVAGNKYALPMSDYPKELINAKRASLLLKRETNRLDEPIKKCAYHGKLYEEDVVKAGKTKAGTTKYRCKKCLSDSHKKHYELHRLNIRLKQQQYKNENREKVKEIKRKWRLDNIETERAKSRERWRKFSAENHKLEKERNAKAKRKMSRQLTDNYMKKLLTHRTNLKYKDIPQSLIEAKRATMKIKRAIQSEEKPSSSEIKTPSIRLGANKKWRKLKI